LAWTYYAQFTNRRQKFSEDLATLGADLEKLSRLAYPECSHEIRDKIACAQFIAGLTDGFIKRTLQLEGISSLKSAVERAMAVKIIQENSFAINKFVRQENKFSKFNFKQKMASEGKEKEGEENDKKKVWKSNKFNFQKNRFAANKECWQCGAQGHFRSECPSISENKN